MIYSLHQVVEQTSEKNSNLEYGLNNIVGVTIEKKMIPTIANLKETNLEKFNLVKPNYFVYNPRTHGKKIGLGFNDTSKTFISTWNNITFKIKNEFNSILLPDYLYLYFNRDIWDKEACFHAWGTSTVVLNWDEFSSMKINIPPMEYQRKIVKQYKCIVKFQSILFEENKTLDNLINSIFSKFLSESTLEYIKLKDICKISAGGDNPDGSTKYKNSINTIPIYSNGVQNDGLFGYTSKAKINNPSITISARGTIGYTSVHFEPYTPIVRLISITPNNKELIGYIYAYSKTIKFDDDGSVQLQVTKPVIENLMIPYSSFDDVDDICNKLNKIVKKIDLNKKKISLFDELIKCIISKIGGE